MTVVVRVELASGRHGVAHAARLMHNALLYEGFTPEQALALTCAWLQGTAGGRT